MLCVFCALKIFQNVARGTIFRNIEISEYRAFGPSLAWMPDELSHAHTHFGREARSGVTPLGRNYLLTKICEEIDRPIKLSGRALYDDGQMINPNVINKHGCRWRAKM